MTAISARKREPVDAAYHDQLAKHLADVCGLPLRVARARSGERFSYLGLLKREAGPSSRAVRLAGQPSEGVLRHD